MGGGICNNNGGATALVTNGTEIHDNTANAGGGLANLSNSTLTFSGFQIINNHAIGGGGILYYVGTGGGILNFGTLNVTDVWIWNNDSLNEGGGIYTMNGNATFTDVEIAGNISTGLQVGGGVYVRSGTATFVSGNLINSNHAVANPSGNGAQVHEEGTLIKNENLNTWYDSICWE